MVVGDSSCSGCCFQYTACPQDVPAREPCSRCIGYDGAGDDASTSMEALRRAGARIHENCRYDPDVTTFQCSGQYSSIRLH